MKLFVKLMLALLVLAVLLPFTLLKDDNGKTLMSLSDISLPDFKIPDFSGSSSGESLVPSIDRAAGMDVFYQWYDGEGNVHFSTEPPEEGIEYTLKEFDPNANVIQAVKLPAEERAAATPVVSPATTTGEPGELDEELNPYDKDNIKKFLDDAKNVEKILQQRLNNQESALN